MSFEAEPVERIVGWAVVEVMGHRKYAALASLVDMGGPMWRVEVPAYVVRRTRGKYEPDPTPEDPGRVAWVARSIEERHPGFVAYLHTQAVFAVTPCTEQQAIDELETGSCHQGPTAPTDVAGDPLPQDEEF